MRMLRIRLPGRGRQRMWEVSHPLDLVRIYDGAANPIGKAYTIEELREMFSAFSNLKFSVCYIPSRAMPFRIPRSLVKFLQRFAGLMVLVEGEK